MVARGSKHRTSHRGRRLMLYTLWGESEVDSGNGPPAPRLISTPPKTRGRKGRWAPCPSIKSTGRITTRRISCTGKTADAPSDEARAGISSHLYVFIVELYSYRKSFTVSTANRSLFDSCESRRRWDRKTFSISIFCVFISPIARMIADSLSYLRIVTGDFIFIFLF